MTAMLTGLDADAGADDFSRDINPGQQPTSSQWEKAVPNPKNMVVVVKIFCKAVSYTQTLTRYLYTMLKIETELNDHYPL